MRTEKVEMTPFGPVMPAHDFIVDVTRYAGTYPELEKLGCQVQEIGNLRLRVVYPPQTTRQELYPRTMSVSYRVLLPNGTELRETVFQEKKHNLYLITEEEEHSQKEE